MKIYLDDERMAPDGWILVKKVEDIIYFYDSITDLSLDHDLGEGNKTGYDFLCWLEEQIFCFPESISKVPNITIHSQNPVGRQNMQRVLQSINKYFNKKMIELSEDDIKRIREDPDNTIWRSISSNKFLSFSFLKEFRNYIHWYWFGYNQELSQDIIREFSDELNWINISLKQKLSKEFIVEFMHKICFPALLRNDNISQEIKDYCRMFI